jgi:hypothetical protein
MCCCSCLLWSSLFIYSSRRDCPPPLFSIQELPSLGAFLLACLLILLNKQTNKQGIGKTKQQGNKNVWKKTGTSQY